MARATKLREKPEDKEVLSEESHFLHLNDIRNQKSAELMKMARDLEIEETSQIVRAGFNLRFGG